MGEFDGQGRGWTDGLGWECRSDATGWEGVDGSDGRQGRSCWLRFFCLGVILGLLGLGIGRSRLDFGYVKGTRSEPGSASASASASGLVLVTGLGSSTL